MMFMQAKEVSIQAEQRGKYISQLDFGALSSVEQDAIGIFTNSKTALTIFDAYSHLVFLHAMRFEMRIAKRVKKDIDGSDLITRLFSLPLWKESADKEFAQYTRNIEARFERLKKEGREKKHRRQVDATTMAQYLNQYGATIPSYATFQKICKNFVVMGWLNEPRIVNGRSYYSINPMARAVITSP